MQIAVFSARPYDRRFLDEANQRDAAGDGFAFVYFDVALDVHTAALAQDCAALCVFVNDRPDAPVLHALHAVGCGPCCCDAQVSTTWIWRLQKRWICSSHAYRPIRLKPWPSMRWRW